MKNEHLPVMNFRPSTNCTGAMRLMAVNLFTMHLCVCACVRACVHMSF